MQSPAKNATANPKPDYNRMMEVQLEQLKTPCTKNKPRLLLHACCAPCSSYVIERLAEFFAITIYYYNPNIHPESEYSRRLKELQQFLAVFPKAADVQLEVPPYEVQDFFTATNVAQEEQLKTEKERGERCRRCYKLRMQKAYDFALKNNFGYFTTTLSISPHKDAEKINAIGKELEQVANTAKAADVACAKKTDSVPIYLFADFKKKNGFKRSLEISSEYKLYRQEYCGCVFSSIDI